VRNAMRQAKPKILEPMMTVEVDAPSEFQGAVVAALNWRSGMIQNSDMNSEGSSVKIVAEVALSNMFGYATELRSQTQGKGEFTMEYLKHSQVPANVQLELTKKYKEEREAENAA
jgi:elongation factor G